MNKRTRNMILIALFSALTGVGAYLEIPTQPVSITMQIFFCMYSGVFLGSKLGAMSQLVYLFMGLAGLPVFAKGTGGFNSIFSNSFGYIIGFILCSFIVGLITERIKEKSGIMGFLKVFAATLIGLAVVYLVGVPYLYMIFNVVIKTPITINTALMWGLYPFIIQDIVKCIIVSFTALKIIPIIKRAGYIN